MSELSLEVCDKTSKELASKILEEQDVEQLKKLTSLFNIHSQKRNVVRIMKLNGLLDEVTDTMIERFEKNPHNFTNDDLLSYMQAAEKSLDRASKSIEQVDERPLIQFNENTQVNIQNNTLTSDSRKRIIQAVNSVLRNTSEIIDQDNGG